MKNFKKGSLEIRIDDAEARTVMTWTGQSDDRQPSTSLNPYLDEILDSVKEKELNIEFEKLSYMNSSTVQPILQFLKKLNEAGIKTRVTYDSNSRWQATSFEALKSFSSLLNHISVEGR